MKIIFVRHGKDDDNYRGGWSNLDLIPEGIEEAKQLAEYLYANKAFYKISKIISSDLPRAMTTAGIIADRLDLSVLAESQLREMDNGDLAGMLNTDALIQYPGLFFSTLRMDEPYPNGESPNDFCKRIKNWFENFLQETSEEDTNVLVVTHGGVINLIYHFVKKQEWSNQNPSFKAANCSIHVLDTRCMEFEIENKTDYIRGVYEY